MRHSMKVRQLGQRAGFAVVGIGVAYGLALAVGFARHGLSEPIADPVLAVMEVLTILSALPILALFVALQRVVDADARPWATLALCFAAMFTAATLGVHVYELTAGRQLHTRGLVWPSASYAIELLAWDLFLGLALLSADAALCGRADAQRLRSWLRLTGAVCIAGLAGPLVGNMRIQIVGVAGYALLLPVAAWMMASWFRHLPPPTDAA
ncbi:MAG: hypothetical protein HY275_02750 [Gemmatimonadetes bacterium]|nr:hypothetical protein [Gemmatimonadota bacterium]